MPCRNDYTPQEIEAGRVATQENWDKLTRMLCETIQFIEGVYGEITTDERGYAPLSQELEE